MRENHHEIRIRITGTDNPEQDAADLTAWLEREPWLTRRRHEWTSRPRPAGEGEGGDETGPADMAIGVDDLILVVLGAVAGEITKGLSIALQEWLRRRREERATGEQPSVMVGEGGGGLRELDGAEGGSSAED
ncbi:hypothetical protein [Streptomyces chattanoogensis]|uniref:hypothetical protein n=1 Tax=Streptomyces chattanoogensis TaxID=66876 RepID=UPI0005D8E7DB|nr:hypothetical protein T261_6294 [Streptomyces lydicus]